jgi:hypothetical protein
MHKLDIELVRRSRALEIYMEIDNSSSIYKMMDYMRENSIKVTNMEIMRPKYVRENENPNVGLLLSLFMSSHKEHYEFLATLSEIEYVRYVEEV